MILLAKVRTQAQRLLARRRCEVGAGSVLYPEARVHGPPDRIRLGRDTHVRGELLALPGGRITLGDWCYLGEHSRIWSSAEVRIGHRVLIAHGVSILDSLTHPLDPRARHAHFRRIVTRGHPADVDLDARPVSIGDDAWIACHAVVLRGVTIGPAAVVGAGSVVTHDVPASTIVAGNPARVIATVEAP